MTRLFILVLAVSFAMTALVSPIAWAAGSWTASDTPNAINTILGPAMDFGETVLEGAEATSSAVRNVAGTMGKIAGNVTKAINIGHKMVAQLGYDIDLNVKYEPEDGPVAIHLRHHPDEDYRKRKIILEAKVEFKGDDSGLIQGSEADWARTALGISLPPKGPVENVRVRFYIDPKTLKWTLVGSESFDGGQLPVWSSYTKADGIARGILYPILEQPYLGGIKKIEEAEVRVKAQVQTSLGVPKDPIEIGAVVLDEFLTTAETTDKIRIERHVPTQWEGTVWIDRSVSGTWSVRKPVPTEMKNSLLMFNTSFSGGEFWDMSMKITGIRLNERGVGSGRYTASVDSSVQSFRRDDGKIGCDDRLKSVWFTVDKKGSGSGEEEGDAIVYIEVDTQKDPHRYSVIVQTAGAGSRASMYPYFAGKAQSTTKWMDCDGQHSKSDNEQFTSKMGAQQLLSFSELVPRDTWPVLDRDAMTLSETLVWTEKPPKKPEGPDVTITTTMKWTLKRIEPKAE